MPATKRKHPGLKIISDEILPSRRSSLQVNLSYVTNLSDSGNESFKSTRLENGVQTHDRSGINLRRIVLPKIAETSNFQAPSDDTGLSAFSQKEMALDRSCKLLKDAIMNKTREIFDGRAELAVKTATILKEQRQALKEINKDSVRAGTNKKIISKNIMHSPSMKDDSIAKTSESVARRTLKSLSRLSNSRKSPILSGSDKSYSSLWSEMKKKVLRVRLTRIADPRLEISMESSQSNISNIGPPITCSSFIGGHGNYGCPWTQQAESDLQVIGQNSDEEELTRNVEESSLSPTEITSISGQLPLTSGKNLTSLRRQTALSRGQKKSMDNCSSVETVPMELTTVQSHIPLRESSCSKKIIRSSVNINTSANLLSRTAGTKISKDSNVASINCENDNFQNDGPAEISLKVNTSLGTETGKTPNNDSESLSDGNEIENSVTKSVKQNGIIISDSDTDSMENISLIARLRNISSKKLHRANRSFAGEGPSFVEGTPYPPSRSILWRTQIKSETIKKKMSLKRNFATMVATRSNSSNSDSEYMTPLDSTVILGNSPCRITCNTTNPQIIQDSSEEDERSKSTSSNLTISNENTMLGTQKTGKKKLLPLRDNFEIASFSPVSPPERSLKKTIAWKPRKHFRKRSTRAVAEKRIEATRKEVEDEDDEPGCSNISAIKTQKGKVKKPRKVISKKIIVKKIAGNELQQQFEGIGRKNSNQSIGSERSSVNEFLKKKKFSVAGRNFRSQKLVIVATGFSKGDVDLIKSIVKELGGAELTSTVSHRTTHVVSTGVRTINLLRGIIRGCWMINLEWVLKSLEKKKWLNAEQYEMVHFSKAVQENRRDREIFGRAYVPELFTTCGPIHIEHGTCPPPEILKELVKTAGGRIAENPRDARLSVGSNGLREIWILDSITTGDLQPIDEYQKKLIKEF